MGLFNISISRSNATQVIALLRAVQKNITDNPAVFTTAAPILAQIDGVLTPLSTAHDAIVEHESVGKSLTVAQQVALVACTPVVKAIGDYGEDVCGGDLAKADLLGLPLAKINPTHALIALGKPTGFSVTTSETPGELDWQCDTMKGARGWEMEASPDPMTPTSFLLKGSFSRSQGAVTGLPSNTKVWLRLRATGGKNTKGPWADPICRVVA